MKEAKALAQIRGAAQALRADGHTDEAFEYFESALAAVLERNGELELLLAKLRRVGTRSERMTAEQLALLLEELQQQLSPDEFAKVAGAKEDAGLEQEIERAKEAGVDSPRARRRSWQARGVERRCTSWR